MKNAIYGFIVLTGSASPEALVWRGRKNKHILIAVFLSNAAVKNYLNRFIYVQVIAKRTWDVF